MSKKRLLLIGGIVAVPLIAVGVWLTAPLFFDKEVDEEFPLAATAEIPDDMTAEEVEAEMEDAAAEPDTEAEDDMMEGEPSVLLTGTFTGADDFHMGSGMATIYDTGDGSHVLRLEDFEVTNGPDLHVYLIPADGNMDGYVDLGSLKGNIGNQNYEIPADVDVSEFGSVLIYCVPFSVEFASAPLG